MLEIRHLATNGTRKPFKVILNEYVIEIRVSALKEISIFCEYIIDKIFFEYSNGIKKIELFKLNRKKNTELL